jgi:hypothetical protein
MINCPMCRKKLRGTERECPNCKTDVSLLVDYVDNLREGLAQAEAYTKSGQLGEAVWAYLEVLEVDPDNATARRQVGKVATAVRQFDRTAPGRRWLIKLQRQSRWRRWLARWQEGEDSGWLGLALWFLLFLGVLGVGYMLGVSSAQKPAPAETQKEPEPDREKDKPRKEDAKEKGLRGATPPAAARICC